MANGNSDGDGISRIIVYTFADFGGDSKTFMESAANASSILEGNKIASFIIQGNPWIFYPEENMKVYIYEIVVVSHDSLIFLHASFFYYNNRISFSGKCNLDRGGTLLGNGFFGILGCFAWFYPICL